jgi:hypothetical protein
MTTCIRKTTWPVACTALPVVILLSTDRFAMAASGGGAADDHVGGPGISDYNAGTGSHGGAAGAVSSHAGSRPGVVPGVGRGGVKGFGWSGSHPHFHRSWHERELRRPLPWSPYLWWGNAYPYCQIDQHGRQHCY